MPHTIGELLYKEHPFEIMCSGNKTDCWVITCIRVRIVTCTTSGNSRLYRHRHAIGGFNGNVPLLVDLIPGGHLATRRNST